MRLRRFASRAVGLAALLTLACCKSNRPAAQASALRIASQTIDSDRTLWQLGPSARESVVSVSSLADDARYSLVADTWPHDIPRLAGTSEQLIALRPSVVFMAEWSDANARALLEGSAGIEVVVLRGFGGFADYRARVRTIAKAAKAQPEGERLLQEFDRTLDDASAAKHDTTIVLWSSGTVAGRGTTFDDAARAAGYVNVAAREGITGTKAVSIEQVVAWQPQAIVVTCESDCAQTERSAATTVGLSQTPAATHKRVIAIRSAVLFDAGFGMLELVEQLAQRAPRPEGT